MAEKQFKPAITGLQKRIDLRKVVHSSIVAGDLRRGSLASLDSYLAKHKGIPDHEVAVELRKLISGTPSRSRFRLVVVEHPDRTGGKGGRPRASTVALTAMEQKIVIRYDQLIQCGEKKYIALEIVEKEQKVSISTIKRVLKKNVGLKREAAERAKISDRLMAVNRRREDALRRFHKRSDSGES